MLKIRLRRSGKKNHPHYRIVVAEHTAPIQGKFIDRLGHFNPHTKDLVLDKEKLLKWINNGATPTNTVAKLMEKEKITHPNVKVIKYKKAPKKTEEDAKPKVTIEAASDETIETTEAPTKESEPTTSDTAIDEAQGEETPAS